MSGEVPALVDVIAGSDDNAELPRKPSAWDLWRALSMESTTVPATPADKARMIERHKLVVNIIEINSQQLRCASAKAGLDIERASVARDAALPSAPPEARKAMLELEDRIAKLDAEDVRLATQRAFLDSSLTEFDGVSADDAAPVGRA